MGDTAVGTVSFKPPIRPIPATPALVRKSLRWIEELGPEDGDSIFLIDIILYDLYFSCQLVIYSLWLCVLFYSYIFIRYGYNPAHDIEALDECHESTRLVNGFA